MLDVLHCVLIDSPEALNMMRVCHPAILLHEFILIYIVYIQGRTYQSHHIFIGETWKRSQSVGRALFVVRR